MSGTNNNKNNGFNGGLICDDSDEGGRDIFSRREQNNVF